MPRRHLCFADRGCPECSDQAVRLEFEAALVECRDGTLHSIPRREAILFLHVAPELRQYSLPVITECTLLVEDALQKVALAILAELESEIAVARVVGLAFLLRRWDHGDPDALLIPDGVDQAAEHDLKEPLRGLLLGNLRKCLVRVERRDFFLCVPSGRPRRYQQC